jgi:tetratricopeptide (TPR) repeat protein
MNSKMENGSSNIKLMDLIILPLLAEMVQYHQEGTASLEYMVMMQNQQRIESGFWPENIQTQEVDVSNLGLNEKAHKYFFNALIAFDNRDKEQLMNEINAFQKEVDKGKLIVDNSKIAICAAGPSRYIPTITSIQKSEIVLNQMNALVAMLENNDELVEKYLKTATELELIAGYDPGPPFVAYPSFEMYGEWLNERERYEEAIVQFDYSLSNRKNRTKALMGKKVALESLGDTQEVAKIENTIVRNTGIKLAIH